MEYVRGLSLDQLDVFMAVAEAGSFSAAARRLNRSQPAITYAIERVEEALGLKLFDRGGYRPVLPPGGQAMLVRARSVAREIGLLDRQAQALRGSVEAEVRLTVDGMFPMPLLMPVVERFRAQWPMTSLSIMVENLSASVETVLKSEATIGLLASIVASRAKLVRKAVLTVDMIALAAPHHPLVGQGACVDYEELARHVQIVLTDRHAPGRETDYGVVSPLVWRTSDLGAKHAMIAAGLGWGSLPLHVAQGDMDAGRLIPVRLPELGLLDRKLGFDLVWSEGAVLGPAARWLQAALLDTTGDTAAHGQGAVPSS